MEVSPSPPPRRAISKLGRLRDMNGQDQLWLAFLKHLKTRQPKNGVLWKEIGQQQAGCTYCDGTGGGALICCSSSDCRVRAHLTCAQVRGSLRLNTDNVLLYSCDKHTEPIHFCTCKSLHDDQSAMTACDSCEEWFHNSCVGLSDSEPVSVFPTSTSTSTSPFLCFSCLRLLLP